MKKSILVVLPLLLMVFSTLTNAYTFEENKKACDGDDASGCYNLGVMYYNGQGVKQSNANALKYLGKACDGGDAGGCKNYAILNKR